METLTETLYASTAKGRVQLAAADLMTVAAELYDELEANGKISLAEAKKQHRFAETLAEKLELANAMVASMRAEAEGVLIAEYAHGEEFDIEGVMFHRYDEVRQNSVKYKDLYAKARGFLKGAELGVLTKMEAAQRKGERTYHRVKRGAFKGK